MAGCGKKNRAAKAEAKEEVQAKTFIPVADELHNPNRPWACTFKDCIASFPTKKELIKHKVDTPEHEYCKKCDEDFEDWDTFVMHKARSPRHRSCRYCGEDFKTDSGLARHVSLNHPVDQDVKCIGCNETFTRAAALVSHLEKNECSKITSQEFAGHLQHKSIINKLLQQPELLQDFNEKIKYSGSMDNSTGGGVPVEQPTTENDEGGISIGEPIQPMLAESNIGVIQNRQPWPELPMKDQLQGANSIQALEFEMEQVSLSEGEGKNSKAATMFASQQNSASPEDPVDEEINGMKSNPWKLGGKSAAKQLFSNAKPTPMTPEWEVQLQRREEEYEKSYGRNILKTRFWDPTSEDYNAKWFYDPVLEIYQCPYPSCKATYKLPLFLEEHIKSNHGLSDIRCPRCLKSFKTYAGLISHCEATLSRCGIIHTNKFGQVIDEISGGFLGVKSELRPGTHTDEVHKLVYTRFDSTKPPDYKDKDPKLEQKKWTL